MLRAVIYFTDREGGYKSFRLLYHHIHDVERVQRIRCGTYFVQIIVVHKLQFVWTS